MVLMLNFSGLLVHYGSMEIPLHGSTSIKFSASKRVKEIARKSKTGGKIRDN